MESQKIKDYQHKEGKTGTVLVSARLPKEQVDWIRENRINLTKLVRESIKKLMEGEKDE